MMWIMILHLFVIMAFAFLDFYLILMHSDELPQFLDFDSFHMLMRVIFCFILGHYLKEWFVKIASFFKKKISPNIITLVVTLIDIFTFLFAVYHTPLLEGNTIFFSQYRLILYPMILGHLLISFFTEKMGFFEIYFTFVVSNAMILWSQSTLFRYCLFRTIFNAGTITLQFLILSLLYPQNFRAYGHEIQNNSLYYSIEKEFTNPEFKYSSSRLFGKQDSFRLIFILFNYCCLELFMDYWQTGNTEFLVIFGLQVYQIVYVVKKYSANTLEKSVWPYFIFYLLYVGLYMHARFSVLIENYLDSLQNTLIFKSIGH